MVSGRKCFYVFFTSFSSEGPFECKFYYPLKLIDIVFLKLICWVCFLRKSCEIIKVLNCRLSGWLLVFQMIASDIVQLQNNLTNMVAKAEQAKRRQTELSHRLLKVIERVFIHLVNCRSAQVEFSLVFRPFLNLTTFSVCL